MTPANWKTYEEIIEETYMKRKILKATTEAQVMLYEGQLASEVHTRLTQSIQSVLIAEPGQEVIETMGEVIEDMGVKRSYICKYGYDKFDRVLGGYKE